MAYKEKRFFFVFWAFCFSVVCSFQAYAGIDRAKVSGFVPHRAVYSIRMDSNRNGSQVTNIHGRMMYEWYSTCDAWVSNHHFNLVYEYADSLPMKITSDFTTYETFDGKSFGFSSQKKKNGALFEELRGRAVLNETEGMSRVHYSLPENLSFELPSGTVFPMGHMLDVIEKTRRGDRFYKAVVFDGSDDKGPVEINSFIGKNGKIPHIPDSQSFDKSLVNVPGRNVRLAFFPLGIAEQVSPDYEMSLLIHENGVISDMLVDYDDFSVTQTLDAIEVVKNMCDSSRTGSVGP